MLTRGPARWLIKATLVGLMATLVSGVVSAQSSQPDSAPMVARTLGAATVQLADFSTPNHDCLYAAPFCIPTVSLGAGLTSSSCAYGGNCLISTIAGTGTDANSGDSGAATSAAVSEPAGVAFDASGNLDVLTGYASSSNAAIRQINGSGTISTLSGTSGLGAMQYLAVGPDGSLYESNGDDLYKIETNGTSHLLQHGGFGGQSGGILVDGAGNVYVGSATGIEEITSGGSHIQIFSGMVCAITFDPSGGIVFASDLPSVTSGYTCGLVRRISPHGSLQHIASAIAYIDGIVVDSAGTIFISLDTYPGSYGDDILDVEAPLAFGGVVGNGAAGFYGDGGLAYQAELDGPRGMAFDSNGNLYIADRDNNRIRKVFGTGGSGVGVGPVSRPSSGPQIPVPSSYTDSIPSYEIVGGGNPAEVCVCGQAQATGYPVNTATGEFWHSFTDLTVPGRGLPLSLSRTYSSSLAAQDGLFGHGWTSNYQMSLSTDSDGNVFVHQENGSQVAFVPDDMGGYRPALPRVLATLTVNTDGSLTFKRRNVESFTFSSTGRLLSESDLNGYTTTLAYDGSGHLTTITDPASRVFHVTTSGGRVTGVHDDASPQRSVSYSYNSSGDLISVTDVGGNVTTFGYDSNHRMTTMLDPNQQTLSTQHPLTNVYDSSGRVTSQTDFAGRETTFDYTSITNSTKVTDPVGNVTVYQYDNGILQQKTAGYGTASAATTSYTYDPDTFALTGTTDPNGHTWTSTFDSAGNQTSGTDPLSHGWTATYNAFGEPLTKTDALGVVTTYTYDSAGNPLTVSTPLTSSTHRVTSYTYGDSSHPGDVTAMTDPNSHVWHYTYDTYGMLASTADPISPTADTTKFCYDNVGRRTRVITPLGVAASVTCSTSSPAHTYQYTTNAYGDVLSTTDPEGNETSQTYDADRNVLTSTDGESNVTDYAYNLDNQRTQVTRADSTTLSTTYYADGSVHTQVYGGGNTTTYTYDALGRLSTRSTPLSEVTTFKYDAAGNLTKKQDPGGNCSASPATGCTTYTYNNANQQTGITYSDGVTPNATFAYDANGRRTSMVDGTGTSTWTYDNLGRVTDTTDGASNHFVYGYDLVGNNTSIDYGSSTVVTRAFDAANRLVSVTDPDSNVTTFSYDANSEETGIVYPTTETSPVTDTFTFDDAGRMSGADLATGSSLPVSFVYTRNGNGQLTSETSTGLSEPAHTYTYNTLGQLASDSTSSGTTTFRTDAAGNPTQNTTFGTQTFNADGELCWTNWDVDTEAACDDTPPEGALVYHYDNRGNRTSFTQGDGTSTYTWDQAGRMTTIGYDDPNYNQLATYTYNGDGLRTSVTTTQSTSPWFTQAFAWQTTGGTPRLLNDGNNLYLYGPDGTVFEKFGGWAGTQFLHHDQLGSTRSVTNLDNTTDTLGSYDPQGQTTAGYTAPIGYASAFNDDYNNVIYLQNRYYDPKNGTFLSRDPITDITGQPYNYINGDPLNGTDPTGLWPNPVNKLEQAGSAIGGGVSAAAGAIAGAASDVGQWATTDVSLPNSRFITGPINIAYGVYKVESGVVLVVAGTAADVTGIGAVLGVPAQTYGVYQITTGAFRVYRGYNQFEDALQHPIVCKSPLEYGADIALDLVPGGGGIEKLLGGLP